MDSMNASSSGMQQKYYDEINDYWYKEDYLGTEGLSEYVTTLLLKSSKLSHAVYEPCTFYVGKRNVIGCKSRNFLHAGETLITSYRLFETCKGVDITDRLAKLSVEERVKYFVEGMIEMTGLLEFGNYMSCLLQLDTITLNDDRHFRNICVVLDCQGEYKLSPIFDNGSSFLSDKYTYGSVHTYDEIEKVVPSIQSKPFSTNFDEQLEACEKLYGSSHLRLSDIDRNGLTTVEDIYSKEDVDRIMNILQRAKRKYSYVFVSEKDDTTADSVLDDIIVCRKV